MDLIDAQRTRADDFLLKPPERAKRKPVRKDRKEFHTLSWPEFVKKEILPNEYQHTSLDPAEDTIRLLRLYQGQPEDSIHCSFEVVPLADGAGRPAYEALSYYWGKSQPSNAIWIRGISKQANIPSTSARDGAGHLMPKHSMSSHQRLHSWQETITRVMPLRFNIRDNLYAALKQFRHPTRDIFLWVDALCIDQENEEEKNQQVAKMARIYTSAYTVLIWLGVGKKDCEEAMDFIDEVIDLRKLDNMTRNEQTIEKWNAFVELFRSSWFSRRWVIQELALARHATVHYSGKSVYWTYFADAVALFVSRIDDIKELFRMSRRYNNNPEHLGDVTALGANIIVNVTRNCFRRTILSAGDFHLKPLSSLEALVSNLLTFEASDPRDTVYALLSIVKDNNIGHALSSSDRLMVSVPNVRRLIPNYTKSAIEVYKDFTQSCIHESRSADIICRHWAPVGRRRSATLDQTQSTTLDPLQYRLKKKKPSQKRIAIIPSWVPKLTGSPFGNPEDALNGRSNGDSLVGHPDRKCYNASKGTVAEVTFMDISLTESIEPLSPKTEALVRDGIADPYTQSSKINHVFYMNIKGFKVDIIDNVSSRIAGGLLLREWLTMSGWKMPDEESNDEVPDKLWRTLVADRGPNGDNPPNWYQRACSECYFGLSTTSGDIDTGALIANPKTPFNVVQYLKRVKSIVWNRVFVTSEKDRFGLAPQGTQKGDFLCILYGCSVPVILREHRAEDDTLMHYQLIGETYIYELMDGEALEIADRSPDEIFKLA